jgi:hypothetical protein
MPLPNFIGIGAARSGTTSLHNYLRQHPDVFLPEMKETHFFSPGAHARRVGAPTTLEEYERLFDEASRHTAIGEISPDYMPDPSSAERIRGTLGSVRLVAILRDPVERAHSHYLHRFRAGLETRPFDAAAREGETYFEWSRYGAHLQRYYALFPRADIHVLLYEDFSRDPAASLRELAEFLGIDASFGFDTATRHNLAGSPRFPRLNRYAWSVVHGVSRRVPKRFHGTGLATRALVTTSAEPEPLPEDQAERLRARLSDDIQATAELIGRDLSHWLPRPRPSQRFAREQLRATTA